MTRPENGSGPPLEDAAYLPALLDALILPGERLSFTLHWDAQRALLEQGAVGLGQQLLAVPLPSDGPLATPCIATVVEVEGTRRAGVGDSDPPRIKVVGLNRVVVTELIHEPGGYAIGRPSCAPGLSGSPLDDAHQVTQLSARLRRRLADRCRERGTRPPTVGDNSDEALAYFAITEFSGTDERRRALLEAPTLAARLQQALDVLRPTQRQRRRKPVKPEKREPDGPEDGDLVQRIEAAANLTPRARALALDLADRFDSFASRGRSERIAQTILDINWVQPASAPVDLAGARRALDQSHAGLTEVKELVIDHLATVEWHRRRSGVAPLRSPHLLLTGPPGVGKTSIADAIARACGRRLERIALGGMTDVALTGSDQAFVHSRPGEIVRRLAAGRSHPAEVVFLLDEVDKAQTQGAHAIDGALLALLDPMQNSAWRDQCLDSLPLDLSSTMFICTANDPFALSAALRDRLHLIEIPGYSRDQRLHIGLRYIRPRLLRELGISGEVAITDEAIVVLVEGESGATGVRSLERQLHQMISRALRHHLEFESPIVIEETTARRWLTAGREPI